MEPDVSAEDITHLEALAITLRRRLRVIETQCAGYGPLAVPPHLVVEKEDAEQQLTRILARLDQLRARPTDSRNPYLGLLTFQEEDADRFFGRDALVADLVALAGGASFLAVLGPSGSGKSSVVRAGLLPMLKSSALPGSEHWRYAMIRPGARPLDALAAELAKLQGSDLDQALRLRANLAEHGNALLLAADLLLDRRTEQRLVLVVDQFEELWTLTPSEERARFINVLLTAANAPDTRLLLVLAMRADFLHRAAEHPVLAQIIADHDVIISSMSDLELRAAIVRPAEMAGGSFEPGLMDELIEQTLYRPGALPLLEYTLQELWKQRDNGKLNWAAYRSLGGIEGALTARADAILAERYTSEQQEDLRRLLLRLVQPGEGAADTRRRVFLDDLVPAGTSLDAVQALLKPLADERLITTGHDFVTDEETIELSHEAIIRAWPTFGRWIDEARADLRFQLQLEESARDWQTSGENADLLWSGLRLAQAEAWIERAIPQLNARDRAFLDASRVQAAATRAAAEAARWREQSQARRLRWLAVILAIAVIAAAGFGIWAQSSANDATNQRNLAQTAQARAQMQADVAQTAQAQSQAQLRVAQSQSLAYAAESLRATSPETALLLASEALRRDNNFVATQTMRDALDAAPWQVTLLRSHMAPISSAVFSQDGQRILIASHRNNTAWVWELSGKELVALQGHTGPIYSAVFSPDGQRILTGSDDQTARVWDLNGKTLAILQGHRFLISKVVFSPDGQRILTASNDQTARLWDLNGKQLAILQGHTAAISSAVFSPDGQRILTASYDKTARLWDLNGKQLAILQGHTHTVSSAVFSPDGQRILTGSDDQTARVWDLNGKTLAILQGHTALISSAMFSPDGQRILTASYLDQTARLWDLNGKQLAILQGHTAEVTGAVFSPDGQRILTASNDQTARLWDLSGKQLAILQGHTSAIYSAVFSPDGQHILTASDDQTARLWDLSGKQLAILQSHTAEVYSAVFSPDGQRILTASYYDQTARLWDLNGKELAILPGRTAKVTGAVFSPDGQRILTASDFATMQVWDLNGKKLATLHGHTAEVNSAVFSPDGQRIVTASDDHTARLWDLNGKELATLQGHAGVVISAVFSPDGQRIVTTSNDKTARVWDLNGKELATLQGHTGVVINAVFSPNGRRILTASYDGTVRQYLVRTEDLLAVADCHVGRGLTDEEIQRFQVPTPLKFDFSERKCPPILDAK